MSRKKKKTVPQATKVRWIPGEVRMWTEENGKALKDKKKARGRSFDTWESE